MKCLRSLNSSHSQPICFYIQLVLFALGFSTLTGLQPTTRHLLPRPKHRLRPRQPQLLSPPGRTLLWS